MPGKLFKYRPFNVRTLRWITHAEVFYCKPRDFNDPLDSDPTIEIDSSRGNLEQLLFRLLTRTKTREQAVEQINGLRYFATEYGDWKKENGEAEGYLKRTLASDIKDELDAELGGTGVLSLSATWSSALMWSHYADEHRGICIEYDISDQDHPRLSKVSYKAPRAIKTSDLVLWKFRNDDEAKDRVFQTYFYAKSSEWRYEKEWRDLQDGNGVYEVPFRMTAIHFGLRCDSSVITTVVKLLSEERQIKLYDIRPKQESFQLRRALIDRDEIEAYAVREPSFLAFKDIVWDDLDDSQDVDLGGGDADLGGVQP